MSRPLRIAATAAALLALLASAPPALAAAPRATLPDIEDEVMCTICGTLLAESESPQADRERSFIRMLIARGEDKGQVEDALVTEYGPNVLATPSGHGFDLLAWLVPGIAIGAALIVIALALSRGRAKRPATSGAAGSPDPADLDRLERDMSSYDV
jgi:cytochrome c-type biogenesis protein CcmH/NrfF